MKLPFRGRSRGFVTNTRTYSLVRIGEAREEDGWVELLLTIKHGKRVIGKNLHVFGQRYISEGHKWSYAIEMDDVEWTLWTRPVVQSFI
jgi:hypothetical protein